MPVDIIRAAVQSEPIRREAVHLLPRARCGLNGARQTQKTTDSRLLVPVLVERLLRSAEEMRQRAKRHHRRATAAVPVAREVPRIDLLEGQFPRVGAFSMDDDDGRIAVTLSVIWTIEFIAFCFFSDSSVGRELQPLPRCVVGARERVRSLAFPNLSSHAQAAEGEWYERAARIRRNTSKR